MKLGRLGWDVKRLSLARFQRNRAMGFGDSAKEGVAEALFFLWRERRTTSATFLGSISAKLPTNTCPGGGSRHVVSYSRKVSIKGSNFPKNPLLGYPICAQPTGHGKCSATPTLFSSPSGHPTDVSFLGDFCWGIYRFPPIRLRMSPYQQWRYLDGDSVAPPGERRDTTQWAYNEYEETSLARWRHHRLRPSRIADMQWYNNPLHIFQLFFMKSSWDACRF